MKKDKNVHNELEHLRKQYDLKHARFKSFGVSEQFSQTMLSNLTDFANTKELSGPDLTSNYNGEIFGIEHFEYDASRKNNRGSSEQKGIAKNNAAIIKEARANTSLRKDYSELFTIRTEISESTLQDNFLRSFTKHQEKIETYIKNIKSIYNTTGDTQIWFLAEDTSAMGPMFSNGLIIDGYPDFPLLPIFYTDIQTRILQSKITGIILLSSFPISNYVAVVKNSQKSFRDLSAYYHFGKRTSIDCFSDLATHGCDVIYSDIN